MKLFGFGSSSTQVHDPNSATTKKEAGPSRVSKWIGIPEAIKENTERAHPALNETTYHLTNLWNALSTDPEDLEEIHVHLKPSIKALEKLLQVEDHGIYTNERCDEEKATLILQCLHSLLRHLREYEGQIEAEEVLEALDRQKETIKDALLLNREIAIASSLYNDPTKDQLETVHGPRDALLAVLQELYYQKNSLLMRKLDETTDSTLTSASKKAKAIFEETLDDYTKEADGRINSAADTVTTLYTALSGDDRELAQNAIEAAIPTLEALTTGDDAIFDHKYFRTRKIAVFKESLTVFIAVLKDYQNELNDNSGQVTRETLHDHRRELRNRLFREGQDEAVIKASLKESPDPKQKGTIHCPIQHGLLVVLQELFYQKNSILLIKLGDLADKGISKAKKALMGALPSSMQSFLPRDPSNREAVYGIDMPLQEVEELQREERRRLNLPSNDIEIAATALTSLYEVLESSEEMPHRKMDETISALHRLYNAPEDFAFANLDFDQDKIAALKEAIRRLIPLLDRLKTGSENRREVLEYLYRRLDGTSITASLENPPYQNQLGQIHDLQEAGLLVVLQELFYQKNTPPSGFIGWLTAVISGLTTCGVPFVNQIGLRGGLWLLDHVKVPDDNPNTQRSLDQIRILLTRMQKGEIQGNACRDAFMQIYNIAKENSVWLGDYANFNLLSESEQKVAKLSIDKLTKEVQRLREKYPDKDHLADNVDYTDLFVDELKSTAVASSAKTVHGIISYFIGGISNSAKISKEFDFPTIYENAEIHKGRSLRENLISEMKHMVDVSGCFFLKRWLLKLSIRPLLWLIDLGVFTFIEKVKQTIMDLIGKTEKPGVDKNLLLIKPLQTLTSVARHIGIAYKDQVTTRPHDDVKETCREHFTTDQTFLEKKGDMQAISLKTGDKLIDDYLIRFHPSKKLTNARETIKLWVFRFNHVIVRGILTLLIRIPATIILWPIENLILRPFEAISNYLIHRFTKYILRKTNAVNDVLEAMGSALKSPEQGAKPQDVVVNQSSLLTDRIKIELFEELLKIIDEKSDGKSAFSTMPIPESAKAAMNEFIKNLLDAVEESEKKAPSDQETSTTPFVRFLKTIMGNREINHTTAECLEELFTRSYYAIMRPQTLTKLLTYSARSTKKALIEKDHYIDKQAMIEEHLHNQERIEYLRLLVLKKSITIFAAKESGVSGDLAITRHANTLKEKLLSPEEAPILDAEEALSPVEAHRHLVERYSGRDANEEETGLVRKWSDHIRQILTTPSLHDSERPLAMIKEELERIRISVTEKTSLLGVQDKAGSGSLGLYAQKLVPVRDALVSVTRSFDDIYDAFFEASLAEKSNRKLDRILDSFIQDTGKITSLNRLLSQAATLLMQRNFPKEQISQLVNELTKLQSSLLLDYKELNTLNQNNPGHKHLNKLTQKVQEVTTKLENYRKELLDLTKFMTAKEKITDHFTSEKIAKLTSADEFQRFIDNVIDWRHSANHPSPLELLFPNRLQQNSEDRSHYLTILEEISRLKTAIRQKHNIDECRRKILTTLHEYANKKFTSIGDNGASLGVASREMTIRSQKSLDHIENSLQNWENIREQAGEEENPILRQMLEQLATLENATTHLDPETRSVQFSLTNVVEPVGDQLIPEINAMLKQISKLFLEQDGPLLGALLRGVMIPYCYPDKKKQVALEKAQQEELVVAG